MLRVGVLVDSDLIPAWVAEVVHQLAQAETIQLSVLALSNARTAKSNFVFSFFKKIDKTLLWGDFDFLKDTQIDSSSIVKAVSGLNNDELAKLSCDLILNLSGKNLPARIPDPGNPVVWKLEIGESNVGGFWEWFYQKPVTRISILDDSTGTATGHTSAFTKTEHLSFSRNETAAYAKAIDVLVQTVRDKSNGIARKSTEPFTVSPEAKAPNAGSSIIACIKLFTRLAQKSWNKLFFIEQWAILFSTETQKFPEPDFNTFKWLLPPKDRIWADPFVVSKDDNHYVFIEEMFLSTRRGHLSCLMLNAAGEVTDSKKILEQSYHLSYPFIFQHEGTWFMIPESGENKTIDLYECTDFPFHWKFRKNLIQDIQAYDATLHVQDGLFWLFCTIQNHIGGSPNNDLHIFFSENLFEDWTPHTLNPVISDPYTARPAGKIFTKNDVLYRPSQICVPRYGFGLSLNKIVKLTKDEYQEERVSKAVPDQKQNQLAIHTLNFSVNFTVIDALIRRSRFF